MKKLRYRKVRKVQPNYYEYTGAYTQEPVAMQLFIYDEENYKEYPEVTLDVIDKQCNAPVNGAMKWLNIHGLHDTELIKKIGELLHVDSFVIGDILNASRRTRIEELDNVLFFTVKSVLPEEEKGSVKTEQISFLLKDNLLISFQEKRSDYFTHIRERIRTGAGIVRKKKGDYLLYLMLDAIMENFYLTLEKFEDRIEGLSAEAKTKYKIDFITEVEKYKESIYFLKRSITPLREALYNLKNDEEDDEFGAIMQSSHTFFARLHQKSLELLDQIEYDLNSLDSASNFYYSAQGQRMNEIMKTLTIVSVVFIPLTFIVGVYGMNFENIPELKSQNGYYYTLGGMVLLVIAMVFYFKNKKWF